MILSAALFASVLEICCDNAGAAALEAIKSETRIAIDKRRISIRCGVVLVTAAGFAKGGSNDDYLRQMCRGMKVVLDLFLIKAM